MGSAPLAPPGAFRLPGTADKPGSEMLAEQAQQSTTLRVRSGVALGVNALTLAGSAYLFRRKHKVAGTIVGLIGLGAAAVNIYTLVSGRSAFGRYDARFW